MLAFSRQFSGIIHRMKTVIPSVQKAIIPKGLSLEKLIGELTLKDDLIEKKSHVISEQKKRIALLEEYLRLEKCRHYGASSEKSPNQEELFNEAEQLVDARGTDNYKAAAEILFDLREAVGHDEGTKITRRHAAHLAKKHPTLNHLKSSLRKRGLLD